MATKWAKNIKAMKVITKLYKKMKGEMTNIRRAIATLIISFQLKNALNKRLLQQGPSFEERIRFKLRNAITLNTVSEYDT